MVNFPVDVRKNLKKVNLPENINDSKPEKKIESSINISEKVNDNTDKSDGNEEGNLLIRQEA